jgi:hypothetical protein
MKAKNILLILFTMVTTASWGQSYLAEHFGYFSRELSFNPMISHEQEDSVSYSIDLSIDSLQAIDSIQIKVSDSLGATAFFRNVSVRTDEELMRYCDHFPDGTNIPINYPHTFRVLMPFSQMENMDWVLVRFRLKNGDWANVVNESLHS